MQVANVLTPRGARTGLLNILIFGLRLYTKYSPFKRGRGLFIRPVEMLKRRGWEAPNTRLGSGLMMEFEPSLIGWTCFERGEWEPEQTRIVGKYVHADAVVLNVGANTGYYALICAAAVRPHGHVHAFEIQTHIIDILRRNLSLNGLSEVVTVVERGCFSTEGEATISCPGDPGSARIDFGRSGNRVQLTTLDRYVMEKTIARVDLILVDAEGADFEILKGAHEVLTRFRPIVIAETDHLSAFGGSLQQLIGYMSEFGYSSRLIKGEFSQDIIFERA